MLVAPYLDTCLLLLVTAAAVNDLASRRIPNLLLLTAFVAALSLHAVSPEPGAALLACVAGAAVGLLIFLPFYLVRGMAAGDVKMMATVGAFTGPAAALHIGVLAWCAGGVMALVLVLFRGRFRLALVSMRDIVWQAALRRPPMRDVKPASAGSMPYGVAIAAATIYVLATRYT